MTIFGRNGEEHYERLHFVVVATGLVFVGIAGQERESSSREDAGCRVSGFGQLSPLRVELTVGAKLNSRPQRSQTAPRLELLNATSVDTNRTTAF